MLGGVALGTGRGASPRQQGGFEAGGGTEPGAGADRGGGSRQRTDGRTDGTRTGKTSIQTILGLSSLGLERAGPQELLALNHGHWEIENRPDHVRDISCNEDRLRIRSGRLADNLAGLANTAISIV